MFRRGLARFSRGRFADATAEGLTFRCYPAENRDDFELVAKGRLPEPEERRWITAHLPHGGVLVDIGANVGVHTIWAASRPKMDVRVIAFEPSPLMRARLSANLALNRIPRDRVRVVAAAVGAEDGTGQLCLLSPGNAGSARLLEGPPPAGSGPVMTVARVRLAQALSPATGTPPVRPDVVKIDIEGREDEVVADMLATFPAASLPGAVVLEVAMKESWRADAVAMLERAGYRIGARTDENVLMVRTPQG